ncbi:MAG: galactokinase [Chitinophagaceae bacterium]
MQLSVKETAEKFESLFHVQPKLFFSPGRINLIGEHIDYNDGFVMPAAIDKGMLFAIAENNSDKINVFSVDMNEWLNVSLNEIKRMEGWKNYLLGMIDQLQKNNFPLRGFDGVFGGDVPIGAGLSSSAAAECGLGFALDTIFNFNISRKNIALLGQKAEHSFPGVNTGIMDQFANMMGEKNHVLLLDCITLDYEKIPFNLKNHIVILINSKVHHDLATGEYNKRRKQCEEGLAIIQKKYPEIKSFREVKPQQVLAIKEDFSDEIFRRCLYVTQEIERTIKAADLLKQNKLNEFGKLMFETHEGLKNLYNVSCPELDFLVDEAKKFPEIIGARLVGGGFGGCTINIIEKEKADEIVSKISCAYQQKFKIEPEVYKIKISDGTHEITL